MGIHKEYLGACVVIIVRLDSGLVLIQIATNQEATRRESSSSSLPYAMKGN